MKVSVLDFDRLRDKVDEHQLTITAKLDDGDFIIRVARSEKEYLANAVVEAQKFVSGQNKGLDQAPPPKRKDTPAVKPAYLS